MQPKKINREKDNLEIIWDDGEETSVKFVNLRNNCPCAICMENKSKKGKNYIPLYQQNELTIAKLDIIGNYALGVTWKDGHNTGIYDFSYLRQLTSNKEKV